jgi:hypothetical protein
MEMDVSFPSSQTSSTDPFHTLNESGLRPQAFFNIRFNIILLSTPRSPSWYLSYVEESKLKFKIKILMRATFLARLIFRHIIILAIAGEECKLCSP